MSENATEIHVLDHKVRLFQAEEGFRTSLDSVFLAAACRAKAGARVFDMGAGVGGATFCLAWRVPECHITGVEIQKSHADLAIKNIGLNNAQGRVEIVCADIRNFLAPERFDHIMCNPPYLESGTYTKSPSEERATALGHQGDMDVKDWVDCGFQNLASGGTMTMIHRADMVDKIIQGMGRRFGAVEIIPLYPRAGADAKRVIVRAIKDRKSPSGIRAGIILHELNGDYTKETDHILRDGKAIE